MRSQPAFLGIVKVRAAACFDRPRAALTILESRIALSVEASLISLRIAKGSTVEPAKRDLVRAEIADRVLDSNGLAGTTTSASLRFANGTLVMAPAEGT
jgi:hypothetical protein